MTLVLVVADKDSFYLIADTRTQDINTKATTDHSKKVFYSTKHKFGLCIAGDAFISDPYNPQDPASAFSVSYLMDAFFTFIDEKNVSYIRSKAKSIVDVFKLVNFFILKNFGDDKRYVEIFVKNVSLFFAGIINDEVIIGAHHGGEGEIKTLDTFKYSETEIHNKLRVEV